MYFKRFFLPTRVGVYIYAVFRTKSSLLSFYESFFAKLVKMAQKKESKLKTSAVAVNELAI